MIADRKILSHSQFRIAAAVGDKQRVLQKLGVDDMTADLAFNGRTKRAPRDAVG
jgi:hypothetical protein